ncbi:MAG: FAD-dependent oxidoreductase [Cyanobacteria bacterium K_Offshore_surface_m2_239]|nr:FAD-dependent oxidoreductase [Cyanobacteria bacterium K_Offshore_surface_m2_239]
MAAITADPVLILGGGLMGLSIAHELARRGEDVLVISRRRGEAAGFVAAGMLAPHAEGLSGALLSLGQASLALIPHWVAGLEADSGLPCGLRITGIVVPFASDSAQGAFPTAAFGATLDREALEREVPGIGPRWRSGLLFRQDGQIDNRRCLMRALEAACVRRGVAFEEGSEVLELHSASGSGEGLTAVRVRRSDGETRRLTCRRAVLTSGAWAAQVLPGLPVHPIKGQMLSLQGPRGALRRVLFGPGTYLVPREDGLVVVGATSEPEAGFHGGLTPAGQRQLEDGVAALLPEASSWPPMERWWGFRPGTSDGEPLLGPGAIPGLWLATGHHRNGVLLAAITAKLMAHALGVAERGERPPSPAEAHVTAEADRWLGWFRPDRMENSPRFGPE